MLERAAARDPAAKPACLSATRARRRALAAINSHELVVLDLEGNQRRIASGSFYALAASADGLLAVTTSSGDVQVYDGKTRKRVSTIEREAYELLAFDPRTGLLVGAAHLASTWDARTGEHLATLVGPPARPGDVMLVDHETGKLAAEHALPVCE